MQSRITNYHLLAKPAGAACNLGCKYCFFLSKENLYGERESPLMSDATLETYIAQLMASSPGPQVDVAWQGGEPMLRGLDFYRCSVALANSTASLTTGPFCTRCRPTARSSTMSGPLS